MTILNNCLGKLIEIYSFEYTTIYSPSIPLNDRSDGGHVLIVPKRKISDRVYCTSVEAIELMTASMIAGQASYDILKVEKVNYQEMGNWSINEKNDGQLHIHVFGRSKKQKYQIRGESIRFMPQNHPIYTDVYESLTKLEINLMTEHIQSVVKNETYGKLTSIISNM